VNLYQLLKQNKTKKMSTNKQQKQKTNKKNKTNKKKQTNKQKINTRFGLGLWCWTPLSTIFQH
jgi:hypothetical protein